MSVPKPVETDPRWGSDQRDAKAGAIWCTMLQQCGPQIAEGVWLDLGCGSGGIAVALAPKVRRMIGIDPEPWKRWAEYEARFSGLTFHGYDGDSPLPADLDEVVDVVICNQVYEHVADPQALLAQIVQVLKPGGRCYFAEPNLFWPIEPHVYWPFVHWLPIRMAVRLMTMLGSSRTGDIDARSVSLAAYCVVSAPRAKSCQRDPCTSARCSRQCRYVGTDCGTFATMAHRLSCAIVAGLRVCSREAGNRWMTSPGTMEDRRGRLRVDTDAWRPRTNHIA